jgi:hypothetical protein
VFAATQLHELSGDADPLLWANRLTSQFQALRNVDTGLPTTKISFRDPDLVEEQFAADFGDIALQANLLDDFKVEAPYYHNSRPREMLASFGLLEMQFSDSLGVDGEDTGQWAADALLAYAEHAYDPITNTFDVLFNDGTVVTPEDASNDGSLPPHAFEPFRADGVFAWAYGRAFVETGNPIHWEMVRNIANGHGLGDIGDVEGNGLSLYEGSAASDPLLIYGLLALNETTENDDLLPFARQVGDNIVEHRYHDGFFAPTAAHQNIKFDAPESLALLHLAAALQDTPGVVPDARPSESYFADLFDGNAGTTYDGFQLYSPRTDTISIEAESYDSTIATSSSNWETTENAFDASDRSFVKAVVDTDDPQPTAAELQYRFDIPTPGTYHVWTSAKANGENVAASDDFRLGIDDQSFGDAVQLQVDAVNHWNNSDVHGSIVAFEISQPGPHTLSVWSVDNDLHLDKILLTTNGSYQPTGNGPAKTPRAESYNASAHSIGSPVPASQFDRGGDGVAFHDNTLEIEAGIYRVDFVDVAEIDGAIVIDDIEPGEWLGYTFDVPTSSRYVATLEYSSSTTASVQLQTGSRTVTPVIDLPASPNSDSFSSFAIGDIGLAAGIQQLRVKFFSGGARLRQLTLTSADSTPWIANNDYSIADVQASYSIDVLANDFPLTNLTLVNVHSETSGSASIEAGKVTFDPQEGFVGTASFQYEARLADKGIDKSDNGHEQFGQSVAIADDIAVVGAIKNDDVAIDAGAAYVFNRDGADWVEAAKLIAADAALGDRFGFAVAATADTVVVSSPWNDDSGNASGAVYVFSRNNSWGQVAKLLPPDGAAGDQFGVAVDIDESTIAIGAYRDDEQGSDSGSVYIFQQDDNDPFEWTFSQKLTASDGAANDLFGISLSLDQETLLVGAHGKDNSSGAAYVFQKDDGNWAETSRLLPSENIDPHGRFGFDITIDGNNAAVGAHTDSTSGSVYTFQRDLSGDWLSSEVLRPTGSQRGSHFGRSVSLLGNDLAVGAPRHDGELRDAGAVYQYQLNENPESNWTLNRQFNFDLEQNANLGLDVAVGNTFLLSGAPLSNAATGDAVLSAIESTVATAFIKHPGIAIDPNAIPFTTTLVEATDASAGDRFGSAVATYEDLAVVGALGEDAGGRDAGAVYVFRKRNNEWDEVAKLIAPDAAAGDRFGYAVDIDGDTIVVGSPWDDDAGNASGSIYVFKQTSNNSWDLDHKFVPDALTAGSRLGVSVAVENDIVAAGAFQDDGGAVKSGAAYALRRSNNSWEHSNKLTAVSAATNDYFGWSVAVANGEVFVGAPLNDENAVNSGAVSVFQWSENAWSINSTLFAELASGGDQFGTDIAVDRQTLAVGAPRSGPRGSAYVFQSESEVDLDWQFATRLSTNNVANNARFGSSLAVQENQIIVAAPRDMDEGQFANIGYVFWQNQLDATHWQAGQRIVTARGPDVDRFSIPLDISGLGTVIGHPSHSEQNPFAGAVTFVTLSPSPQ